MEIFGIIFSFPLAMIASSFYMLLLEKTVKRVRVISKILVWISIVILLAFLSELVCVSAFGSIKIREVIGPSYFRIHLYLFMATTPEGVKSSV